jgi:hypothetical protein
MLAMATLSDFVSFKLIFPVGFRFLSSWLELLSCLGVYGGFSLSDFVYNGLAYGNVLLIYDNTWKMWCK